MNQFRFVMESRIESTRLENMLLKRYCIGQIKGEKGDIFYMIEEGTLIATKTLIQG